MSILQTTELKKYYGAKPNITRALDGVTLSIEEGEFVAIVGTSGSGKSTLLNMIGGLDVPTSGKVIVDGRELSTLKDEQLTIFRRRKIGFIFQNYNLVPVLNVYENIVLPVELDGNKVDKKFMKEVVQMLGLEDKLNNMPNNLSGGQQQRVAIARALVKMPRVLLLDEPLSNLDARLRLQTREEIRKIQRATKITTVFVTHDQEEAMSISDMIVVMKDGVVQQIGKPQNVYDSPVNLFVAKFLGTPPINVFEGQIRGGSLYIGENAVLLTPGISDQPVSVGIRPEGFIPDEKGALCCQLGGMEVMGRDISVVSTHASSVNPVIRSIISSDTQIRLDAKTIRFSIKPNKIFLFRHDTGERINL